MNKLTKITALIFLFTEISQASEVIDQSIHWGWLIVSLLGGLSLFLYGIEKMSSGMKKSAGNRMRSILAALSKNRVIALFVGAFVTMVIQSSSATTVMLVSFVQAQLMNYVQTIGIILGANIGTTVTAQLVAFKLTDFALVMVTVGFALTLFSRKDSTKHLGEALLGFGILFFGMKLMGDAMKPLRTFEPFINMMKGLENPFLGLLLGSIFTALIQSSSAFTGIVIVLAQQGLLPLESGIPLILGANIGTCITAGFASIGTSREAKRVAMAHILFNVSGVILFIFLVPYLTDFVKWISPVVADSGSAKLAAEVPRQIANAHTVFNVAVAVIFLPMSHLFAKLVLVLLPIKGKEKKVEFTLKYLDKNITTPAISIDLVRAEISRMASILREMLGDIIPPFINKRELEKYHNQSDIAEDIRLKEKSTDFLEENISKYLISISRTGLDSHQSDEVYALMSITKDMESIGDVIGKNMLPLILKKQAIKSDFSKDGIHEMKIYHEKICKQISRIREALKEPKMEDAKKILSKKKKYSKLESDFRRKHMERVQKEMSESIETREVHLELMDLLKQINVYAGNIAKTMINVGE